MKKMMNNEDKPVDKPTLDLHYYHNTTNKSWLRPT